MDGWDIRGPADLAASLGAFSSLLSAGDALLERLRLQPDADSRSSSSSSGGGDGGGNSSSGSSEHGRLEPCHDQPPPPQQPGQQGLLRHSTGSHSNSIRSSTGCTSQGQQGMGRGPGLGSDGVKAFDSISGVGGVWGSAVHLQPHVPSRARLVGRSLNIRPLLLGSSLSLIAGSPFARHWHGLSSLCRKNVFNNLGRHHRPRFTPAGPGVVAEPVAAAAGGASAAAAGCHALATLVQGLARRAAGLGMVSAGLPAPAASTAAAMLLAAGGSLLSLGAAGLASASAAADAEGSAGGKQGQELGVVGDLEGLARRQKDAPADESSSDPFSLMPGAMSTELDELLGPEDGEITSVCVAVTHPTARDGALVEPKTKVRFPLMLCGSTAASAAGAATMEDDASSGAGESSDGIGDGIGLDSAEDRAGGADPQVSSIGSSPCQLLAGVGSRSKLIAKIKSIKVYAFGLYVRPDKLKEELGEKYKAVPPEELKIQEEFYNDILSREVGMTVRLVVHYRGLKMDMVQKAFNTSLTRRLIKIAGHADDPGLKTFNDYLSRPQDISRGTTIDFCWETGGRLVTKIDGRAMDAIQSPNLCRALFDLYIGDQPVSVEAKHKIGESIARMITEC